MKPIQRSARRSVVDGSSCVPRPGGHGALAWVWEICLFRLLVAVSGVPRPLERGALAVEGQPPRRRRPAHCSAETALGRETLGEFLSDPDSPPGPVDYSSWKVRTATKREDCIGLQ